MNRSQPNVAVFAPYIHVSMSVERGEEGFDDVHLHPGGQGIWIARLLTRLGERPVVCAPIGGESGHALEGLVEAWGIDLESVPTRLPTPSIFRDRRNGDDRRAHSRPPTLDRHEHDQLYDMTLRWALATHVCVVCGRFVEDNVPDQFYRRLGADLAAGGVRVVGDLHGSELRAFLDGGPIEILKVSHGDLVDDGLIDEDDETEESAIAAAAALIDLGARAVVVSRGPAPAIATFDDRVYRVSGPNLEVVDTSGSGDSMTAAFATALVRDLDAEEALALAWAAGAANITRQGLGSAPAELIEELRAHANIERVDATTSSSDGKEGTA